MKCFFIALAYLGLLQSDLSSAITGILKNLNLPLIWDMLVPSKVIIFPLQILLEKIPTRENIFKPIVLVDLDDLMCPMCRGLLQLVIHLLMTCVSCESVWYQNFRW